MAAPNELEARVAALETQVAELAEQVRTSKQDAAAARVLAGGADRDVTEIRAEIRDFRQATTSSFNAMRDELRDLRREPKPRERRPRRTYTTRATTHQHSLPEPVIRRRNCADELAWWSARRELGLEGYGNFQTRTFTWTSQNMLGEGESSTTKS